jgi:hypothetical protein
MPTEMNKVKVLGELFHILVKLNELKEGHQYKRLSPQTKEVIDMLVTSVRACQEAVRSGHPLLFEINVWEQLSLSGWAIDVTDGEHE